MLAKDEFDLVLLDIGLPDGSGLDLLGMIHERLDSPKVVIFSAYDVTEEYLDKVSAVLVKSRTSNEQLLDTITAAIELSMSKR